jgi:hypothetical protein
MAAPTLPNVTFTPATRGDMPFIEEAIQALRLDSENLAP